MKNILFLIKFEMKRVLTSNRLLLYAMILIVCFGLSVYFYNQYGSEGSVLTTPNGQSFAIQHLQASYLFMGTFIAIYGTELILQDCKNGTIKNFLTRPVSRIEYFTARCISLWIYTLLMSFMIIILGYLVGTIAFGWGSYMEFMGTQYSISAGIANTLLSGFVYSLPYLAFGLIAMWLSMLIDNVGLNVLVMVVIILIGQYAEVFPSIKDFALNHQMLFFQMDVMAKSIVENLINVGIVFVYIVVFFTLGLYRFKTLDLKV